MRARRRDHAPTPAEPDPDDARAGGESAGPVRRRLERLARLGPVGLAVASFLESTFVPFMIELVLIPAMQSQRRRIGALALGTLLGCLAGAAVGYALGRFAFDVLGEHLIDLFGSREEFESSRRSLNEHGFWFVLLVGVSPLPFQIAMLAAGVMKYSLVGFLTATAIARGVRYFGVAWLVKRYGDAAEGLYRRHKLAVALGVTLFVVVLWLILKQLA